MARATKTQKSKKPLFPETLYVVSEGAPKEEPYLLTFEDIDDIEDGKSVAVYELVRIATLRATRELRDE